MKLVAGAAVVGFVVASGVLSALQTADLARFTGTWTLDAAASTNPNGAGDAGAPWGHRYVSREERLGIMGPYARARLYRMLTALTRAPVRLVLSVNDVDVTVTSDDDAPLHLVADGKKQMVPADADGFHGNLDGHLEITTKREGASLICEIKTIDALTVTTTYTLNSDGTQLTVLADVKSLIERLSGAQRKPIRRVYQRAVFQKRVVRRVEGP